MVSPPTTKYQVRYLQQRVVLTEATGDAELVVWPIWKTLTGTSLPPLHSDTYEEARYHAQGWDIRALEAEWRDWVAAKNITVRNADSNFISFCKKRGPYKNEELF